MAGGECKGEALGAWLAAPRTTDHIHIQQLLQDLHKRASKLPEAMVCLVEGAVCCRPPSLPLPPFSYLH